jgi:diguanylate cyclase (GGDEF)-like protein
VHPNIHPSPTDSNALSLEGALQLLAQSGHRLPEPQAAGKAAWLQAVIDGLCELSSRDPLTGLANRRQFELTLASEVDRVARAGEPALVLMIDIDHFKKVNDTWGHQTGDAVLRHLAGTVQKTVRGEDHVARYGGEEFAVILPRTVARSAVVVAENIRQALAREPIALDVSPPMTPITVSIGVACYEPGDPLAEWIERSDAALYQAKREGRNRVELDRMRN